MIDFDNSQYNVIASMYLDGNLVHKATVELGVTAGDFRGRYRKIFEAMVELYDEDKPINEPAVADHLGVPLDEVFGFTVVPHLSDFRTHVELLLKRSEWQRRQDALTNGLSAVDAYDEMMFQHAVAQLQESPHTDSGVYSPERLASEFVDWLEDDSSAGILTQFPELNAALAGGFKSGDTSIIAAWSSMGKSVLTDQFLEHAHSRGHSTCLYTNEMNPLTRVARTVARRSSVPYERIAAKLLNHGERREILGVLNDLPTTLVEVSGWSAERIARHVRKQKSAIAAVDLVTRIPASDVSEWDRVSGVLTDAARQSDTHLLLVCQLNLERNKGAVKPAPVGRDLRNTGSWFNDAANVLLLHREQEPIEGMGVAQVLNQGNIRIDKSRHGQVGGLVVVEFDPDRMRFDSYGGES